MNIKRLTGYTGMIVLLTLSLTTGCDNLMTHDTGFLEGVISIGPLCPVETVPPGPACLPTAETYKAYPVSIWTANGRRKIAQLYPALDGSYSTELVQGNYLVILGNGQIKAGSSNLPVEVSIQGHSTTKLNISIDTGIR
jgi:hypothetical protein